MIPFRISLVLFFLNLLVTRLAVSKIVFEQFEKPTESIELKLTTSQKKKLSCWLYNETAILQLTDSDKMGSEKIVILENRRLNTKKKDILKAVCRESELQNGFTLKELYGYFLGRIENNYFVEEPDAFGNQQRFSIYDQTGEKLFEDLRDIEMPFQILSRNPLELDYFQALPIQCPMALEPNKCWNEVLKKYKIPKALDLKMPDCKEAFLKESSKFENRAIISTQVRLQKLESRFAKTYLGGIARCKPAP